MIPVLEFKIYIFSFDSYCKPIFFSSSHGLATMIFVWKPNYRIFPQTPLISSTSAKRTALLELRQALQRSRIILCQNEENLLNLFFFPQVYCNFHGGDVHEDVRSSTSLLCRTVESLWFCCRSSLIGKKSFKIINAIQIKISIKDFDHTHVSGGAVSKWPYRKIFCQSDTA